MEARFQEASQIILTEINPMLKGISLSNQKPSEGIKKVDDLLKQFYADKCTAAEVEREGEGDEGAAKPEAEIDPVVGKIVT